MPTMVTTTQSKFCQCLSYNNEEVFPKLYPIQVDLTITQFLTIE